jgi:Family of unknown function (DUF6508)
MERGEWQKGDWSDRQRLEALAKYLPIFTAPGFQFSEVVPAKRKGDVIQMGWTSYGPEAQSFMQDCYDYGWVQSTHWMEWMRSDEAQALSEDAARMASATVEELAKVLTVSLRRDRFMDGSLAGDFERGLITRIVARAHELSAAKEAKPLRRLAKPRRRSHAP